MYNRPSATYYFAAIVFFLTAITNFSKGKTRDGIIFLAITIAYILIILFLKRRYDKHQK